MHEDKPHRALVATSDDGVRFAAAAVLGCVNSRVIVGDMERVPVKTMSELRDIVFDSAVRSMHCPDVVACSGSRGSKVRS